MTRRLTLPLRSSLSVRALSLLVVAGLLVASCGDSADDPEPTLVPTPSPQATADPACSSPGAGVEGNALQNGGFEEGSEPWASLAAPEWGRAFAVSQAQARSGSSSAYLQLRSADGGATKVYGLTQDITPAQLPETLAGFYFVENWEQGTPKQYLQAVVIVHEADNIPQEVRVLGANNYQMRYILAGSAEQPTQIANARYVMVSADAPAVGQWVPFELNVAEDFCQLWGNLPTGFARVSVFFEARWDGRAETNPPSNADVYYDDLYFGPAAGAP